MYQFMNARRSVDRYVNTIKAKIGGPEHVTIAFGDACVERYGADATTNNYLVLALRRHKYSVVMIDEKYTSQVCSTCEQRTAIEFLKNSGRKFVEWRLKGCTLCNKAFNRDRNAAINIGMHLYREQNKIAIPEAFSHTHIPTKNQSGIWEPSGFQRGIRKNAKV